MLETIDHGNICELKLSRPPANALNPALVQALTRSLEEAGENASAVVVSGRPGMFSGGLDIPELIEFDSDRIYGFWLSFLMLLKTIAHMPVPTVFAMTGHAPAGGIVMALFGDYRIMPRSGFKTGFNEAQVGLVVPSVVHRALVRTVGAHTAERILVAGEMMESERALAIGLVDELVDKPEDAVTRGVEWCDLHLALPGPAMQASRSMARTDLHALFDDEKKLGVEKFVDIWFSESTRNTLRGLVDRLQKK